MWMLKAVVTVIVVVNIDSVDGTEICIKYSFLESSMRVVCSKYDYVCPFVQTTVTT